MKHVFPRFLSPRKPGRPSDTIFDAFCLSSILNCAMALCVIRTRTHACEALYHLPPLRGRGRPTIFRFTLYRGDRFVRHVIPTERTNSNQSKHTKHTHTLSLLAPNFTTLPNQIATDTGTHTQLLLTFLRRFFGDAEERASSSLELTCGVV